MSAAGVSKTPKRKRAAISGFTKREICQKLSAPNPPKQKDLALVYNISEQAVSDIWRDRNKWLQLKEDDYNAQLKKERLPGFPMTEKVLERWLQYASARQMVLTDDVLIEKAKNFASSVGEEHFRGSNGWLARFKLRHGIKMYVRVGEGGSAPPEAELNAERERLRAIITQYPLDDVWNADETGIFWKQEPKRTLAISSQQGHKLSKERITCLVACNATGNQKLKLPFIHKYKTPRSLRNVNYNMLPVSYFWNKTCWMQV